MFERFTDGARKAVTDAQVVARRLGHDRIGTEHVLLGLVEGDGVAAQVLGETEQVWRAQFSRLGRQYQDPTLVLYTGATQSGCGGAQSQVGPFYCPNDRKVYIDLDFMARLQQRLGAQGDFADNAALLDWSSER